MAALQILSFEHSRWHTQPDQYLYSIIDGSNAQRYICAKRESTQYNRQAGIATAQKFKGKAHIIHLSTSFIVYAGAMANSSKIETQGGHSKHLQCLRHFEN